MTDYIASRDFVQAAVRRELFGPHEGDPAVGKPLDIGAGLLRFNSWDDAAGPWHDAATHEEVLDRDIPTRRYGVGVLYPVDRPDDAEAGLLGANSGSGDAEDVPAEDVSAIGRRDAAPPKLGDAPDDDLDLTPINSLRQCGMGVSGLLDLATATSVAVRLTGARYEPVRVVIGNEEREWWLRVPITLSGSFDPARLRTDARAAMTAAIDVSEGTGALELEVRAFSRPHADGQL